MDQDRSSVPEDQSSSRSGDTSDKTTQDDNIQKRRPAGQVDIIAMVRSLQRAAGMTDCFRRGNADCDSVDCDWRTYCIGASGDQNKETTP